MANRGPSISRRRAQVIRQKVAEPVVQVENASPHGQKMLPASELNICARQGVVTFHDRRIEGRDQRWMEKIKQICDGRA